MHNSAFAPPTLAELCIANLIAVCASVGTASAQFTLEGPNDRATEVTPRLVATGDLNDDGRLDFVLADQEEIAVILSSCHRDYAGVTRYPIGSLTFSFIRGLAIGDIDGDGLPEIIAVRANGFPLDDGIVTILQNSTNRTFRVLPDYPVVLTTVAGSPITPRDVDVADMNGDGALDIVVASTQLNLLGQPGFFSIVLNETKSGGPIALAGSVNIPAREANSSGILAADNDGDQDLATSNRANNGVSIFRNDGSGVTGVVNTERLSGSNAAPTEIVAGDINNDGFLDLVTLSLTGLSYSTVLNLNGGTNPSRAGDFNDRGQSPIGTQGTPVVSAASDVALADFDGDGNLDLAASFVGSLGPPGSIAILPGDGAGNFGAEVLITAGQNYSKLAASDMDADGDIDLVSIRSGPARVVAECENGAINQWVDLGNSLVGSNGVPCLRAIGTLAAGSVTSLRLQNSVPLNVPLMFIGFAEINLPFAGGVVVPDASPPNGFVTGGVRRANAKGEFETRFSWPNLPLGSRVVFQSWMFDPEAQFGFSSTNAIRAHLQ